MGTYGKLDTASGSNKGGTVSETLLVHPATTCSATSVATGTTLSLTTSGTADTFTITARDAYNNQRTVNTDMTFTWIYMVVVDYLCTRALSALCLETWVPTRAHTP